MSQVILEVMFCQSKNNFTLDNMIYGITVSSKSRTFSPVGKFLKELVNNSE